MSDFTIKKVCGDNPYRAAVRRIYMQSFPLFERVSLEPFFTCSVNGAEMFVLLRENEAEAFFCTLKRGRFFYLFYIAVDEKKRGRGIGSDVIKAAIEMAAGKVIFLDCEGIYPGCTDRAKRVRRLCFYRKNGFREVGGLHEWRGEKFVTLVHGDAEISEEDIQDFWRVFGKLWDSEDVVGDLDKV